MNDTQEVAWATAAILIALILTYSKILDFAKGKK